MDEEEEQDAEWFLRVLEVPLLRRDLEEGFQFAFPSDAPVVTVEALRRAFETIGEQVPCPEVLRGMVKDVGGDGAGFSDVFDFVAANTSD
jgi:Ca2+-binding EF-hand superfamily protein